MSHHAMQKLFNIQMPGSVLLSLDDQADNHLPIGIRMRQAGCLRRTGGSLVANDAIGRIRSQLESLGKAVVGRI